MSLTPEMIAAGWIAHTGGPCPVDMWQPVTIMRRDGKVAKHPDCRSLDWRSYPEYTHTDIIAYKPESPSHDQ